VAPSGCRGALVILQHLVIKGRGVPDLEHEVGLPSIMPGLCGDDLFFGMRDARCGVVAFGGLCGVRMPQR
jgi:hypothetical protein